MIDIAIGAGLTGGLVVLSISLVITVYNFVASKIAPTTLENNVIQEGRKKELQDKELQEKEQREQKRREKEQREQKRREQKRREKVRLVYCVISLLVFLYVISLYA